MVHSRLTALHAGYDVLIRVFAKMINPCSIMEGWGFDKSLRGYAHPHAQIPTAFQIL
jgi:hypothetical protein